MVEKLKCIVCTESPELEYTKEMILDHDDTGNYIEGGELVCPVCNKIYWIGG